MDQLITLLLYRTARFHLKASVHFKIDNSSRLLLRDLIAAPPVVGGGSPHQHDGFLPDLLSLDGLLVLPARRSGGAEEAAAQREVRMRKREEEGQRSQGGERKKKVRRVGIRIFKSAVKELPGLSTCVSEVVS